MDNAPFEQNTPFDCLRLYTWSSRLSNGRPFEISFVHWNEMDARTSLLKRLHKAQQSRAEYQDQYTANTFMRKNLAGFEDNTGAHRIFDFTEDTPLHDGTTLQQLIIRGKPSMQHMNYSNIVVH